MNFENSLDEYMKAHSDAISYNILLTSSSSHFQIIRVGDKDPSTSITICLFSGDIELALSILPNDM